MIVVVTRRQEYSFYRRSSVQKNYTASLIMDDRSVFNKIFAFEF